MPKFSSDTLIKELRLSRGITQATLAEGICTTDTLSRIERGQRRPDWYTFERLMQRLGEDPHKYYYDIITKKDKQILDTKEHLTNLIRRKKFDEVETTILGLENDQDFQAPVHLQFLIRMKATLFHAKKDYQSTYAYSIKALNITKPNFNEDEINSYILSYDEIMLVNLIATAHFHITSVERSTDILLLLKESIDRGYVDEVEKSKTYIRILYNISKNLGLLKRYDEDIKICNEALEYCIIYRDSHFHPLILFNKTYALFYTGNTEEGTELFKTTYSLFRGLERYDELSQITDFIKNEFNITP